jgi:hypothetical protein
MDLQHGFCRAPLIEELHEVSALAAHGEEGTVVLC